MSSPAAKPWRYTGRRPSSAPGANWTAVGAYRILPTTRPRPDHRPASKAT